MNRKRLLHHGCPAWICRAGFLGRINQMGHIGRISALFVFAKCGALSGIAKLRVLHRKRQMLAV